MKKKVIKRTITGIVFVIAVVGCTLSHPLAFGFLFTLASALTVHEYARVVNEDSNIRMNGIGSSLAAACLFLATMGHCTHAVDGPRLFIPYILIMLYLLISELYLKKENPIGSWACAMFSQVYIALPFALLNLLAYHHTRSWQVVYNPLLPLSVFVFLWLSDTGAYCVGTLLGRHKLFPRVSPKKTWEGTIGGVVLAVASSLVFAHYSPAMSTTQWMGLSAVVAIIGSWGDLTESLMKRQKGLKDSGNILPGHGGMLDRFDSMLLAVPAAVAYLWLIA